MREAGLLSSLKIPLLRGRAVRFAACPPLLTRWGALPRNESKGENPKQNLTALLEGGDFRSTDLTHHQNFLLPVYNYLFNGESV